MLTALLVLGLALFVGLFIAGLRRWPWWTPFAVAALMGNLALVLLPLLQGSVDWALEVQRLTLALALYLVTYWSGRGAARMMGPPGA